jgi:hypothetical protein
MNYQIYMEVNPGDDQVWVARLNADDPLYIYDNIDDAQTQANILKSADDSGREYVVVQVD